MNYSVAGIFKIHFTFQSGYIPTQRKVHLHMKYVLYIPIWLYSNKAASLLYCTYEGTLHSNLVIFQPQQIILSLYRHYLYIPIWLYSNSAVRSCNEQIFSLHSNLVIFQPSHYNTTYLQTLKAAFCRPSFFNPSYRNIFCELFLLSLFRPLLQ